MVTTIEYQGYTITAPDGPPEQGTFTSHPTSTQVVSQVDSQLVYTEPQTFETIMGEAQANELIWGTVTFQCHWDTIANVMAQDSEATKTVTYTAGITTTDSDTKSFSMTLGVEGAIDVLKAALGATFSDSETHSVALSETRSVTYTYKALPNTTLQVWQLHSEYIAEYEKDGKTYRYTLANASSEDDGPILALTFPDTSNQPQ